MSNILEIKSLNVHFRGNKGIFVAVDDISFEIKKKEKLAIVGESGSGKSVTAMAIMGLLFSNRKAIISGQVIYSGKNIFELSKKELQTLRKSDLSMIFQDPVMSLNPVFTIGQQLVEAYIMSKKQSKKQANDNAVKQLEKVGILDAKNVMHLYPHQLSGGMCQRVMIAIALASNPQLLIADEATTALDVTIQAQILKLLDDLHHREHNSLMFITHDLIVAKLFTDRIIVMNEGRMVESGRSIDVYDNPLHPYTKLLIQAVPTLGKRKRLHSIPKELDSSFDRKQGCQFYERCNFRQSKCLNERPSLRLIDKEHAVACHFCEEIKDGSSNY